MKYVKLDDNLRPIGYYTSELHGDNHPDKTPITDAQWQYALSRNDMVQWNDITGDWDDYIPEIVLADAIELKVFEIKTAYEATFLTSIDCTSNGIVYTMNNGKVHAQTLKSGYDLAVLNDETSMNIVDFYDVIHSDISLIDVEEIIKQQGLAARQDWEQKVSLKRAILDATSVEQIDLISWE